MPALSLPASSQSAASALVNVIYAALRGPAIRTGGQAWPCSPFSLDFSAGSNVTLSIDGNTGLVTIAFASQNVPSITGTLDLSMLEAQLVSAPNYVNVANDGLSVRPGVITGTTVSFGGSYSSITAQKSGIMYVDAEISGTQSLQQVVISSLYRDYGLSGQTLLGSWSLVPGGVGGTNYWSASISAIDSLPDKNPHTYTIIAVGSSGSVLTVPASVAGSGPANFQIFEIGQPG